MQYPFYFQEKSIKQHCACKDWGERRMIILTMAIIRNVATRNLFIPKWGNRINGGAKKEGLECKEKK